MHVKKNYAGTLEQLKDTKRWLLQRCKRELQDYMDSLEDLKDIEEAIQKSESKEDK